MVKFGGRRSCFERKQSPGGIPEPYTEGKMLEHPEDGPSMSREHLEALLDLGCVE